MDPSSFLRSPRWLVRGALTAWSVHFLAIVVWLLIPPPEPSESIEVVVVTDVREFLPPPISPTPPAAAFTWINEIIQPAQGIPVPVYFEPAEWTPDFPIEAAIAADFAPWDGSSAGGRSEAPLPDGIPVAAAEPEIFRAVEVEPVLLHLTAPVYPELARAAGVEGVVIIDGVVETDGRVGRVEVVSGPDLLAEAAREAMQSAIFRPGMQQGRPVAVWVRLPLRFELD